MFAQILSLFGTTFGSIFSYLWGLFQKEQQDAAAAESAMKSDMDLHSGDGALSVGDMQSAQAQMADLKNQLDQLDNQQPVTEVKS